MDSSKLLPACQHAHCFDMPTPATIRLAQRPATDLAPPRRPSRPTTKPAKLAAIMTEMLMAAAAAHTWRNTALRKWAQIPKVCNY